MKVKELKNYLNLIKLDDESEIYVLPIRRSRGERRKVIEVEIKQSEDYKLFLQLRTK